MANKPLPKHIPNPAARPLSADVSLLGLDADELSSEARALSEPAANGFEEDDSILPFADDDSGSQLSFPEKIINYVTLGLTLLLLGGSFVFWWVIVRYLIVSPYMLADPTQMRVLMISCAAFPAVVTAVQWLLRRKLDAERWLICMCISGALATLTITITQLIIRSVELSFSELGVIACCAVSGCALPSISFIGIRRLIERNRAKNTRTAGSDWAKVKRDVSSISDFDL